MSVEATDTRTKILTVAEKLYAEQGFEGMSTRALTSAAGVNVASVNYHFGSKKELVMAMFQERIVPMNAERLALLEKARAGSHPEVPSVEAILDALFKPVASRAQINGQPDLHFLRMVGRAISESEDFWHELFIRNFRELTMTFIEALMEAVPELPLEEIQWRFHFIIGSMLGALVKHGQFCRKTEGLPDAENIDVMFERLRDFLAAGFRSPLRQGVYHA